MATSLTKLMDQKQEFSNLKAANEDRISELPDCVLSYILCKLAMRDMMKTRVLSKRWQGLWALRRDLTFDFSHMCDDVVKILENVRFRNDLEYFARINEDYVKRVDEFMQTFPGEKIDFLRLFYFGDTTSTDESIVDKCVRHAIAKGVEQIDMISASMLPHFRRRFPFWLFPVSNKGTKAYSTLKHLYLRYFVLAPPPDFTGFHNLESLTLECTIVTEDLFKYLLSDPVTPLRVLRLIGCRFEFDLEIVSPSLHHFEMIECLHLGTLTISAIKLTVFEYHCFYKYERDLFLNAPQLTNMYFHKLSENQIPAAISQFIATQVENLNLRIVTEKVMPRSITPFWNLKQLELTVESVDIEEGLDVLLVFSFLKASPLLQKLKFRRWSSASDVSQKPNESERWTLHQEFSHNELQEVEILGCVGNWCEIELAIYLMQKSRCLDKLVFNPSRSPYPGGGKWDKAIVSGLERPKSCQHWLESGRETVREKLQDKVPASVKLLLL